MYDSDWQYLKLTRKDRVLTVEFDSGTKVNSLSHALMRELTQLAAKVAAMPPLPVRMAKRAINTSANALNDATSFMDADQFLLTQAMDDAREGALAFFEKRIPQFKGK